MYGVANKTGVVPKRFPGQVRPAHTPDVIVVEIPGPQGPAGAKEGVLFTEQTLTEDQKGQARQNIDAASLIDLRESQGFSTRHIERVIDPAHAMFVVDLNPAVNVRVGDTVIDSDGNVYLVKAVKDGTFTVSGKVTQFVTASSLGKLASKDEVGAGELSKIIDLGAI